MSLARFFTEERFLDTVREASLAAEDIHHAARVLRLKVGEEIELVDGEGQVLHLLLTHVSTEAVTGEIISRKPVDADRIAFHLLQGLPRGSKVDEIIQKGIELGLDRFYPLLTQQSQIRLDAAASKKKQERWTKIAEMAASQSARNFIPEVLLPQTLEACLQTIAAEDQASGLASLNIICWEKEEERSLASVVKEERLAEKTVVRVLVGPEGGFADGEVEMAQAYGFIPVSLGSNILRTETAGPAVLAMLGFALELL